jgi:hypothetical protein
MSWVTIRQFADDRGVTPHCIRKHIKKGRIPGNAVKARIPGGKHLLIHREKANAALEKNVAQQKVTDATKVTDVTTKEKIETIEKAGLKIYKSLTEAQAVDKSYAAALKKLKYEIEKDQWIHRPEAEKICFMAGHQFKQSSYSMVERLTPLIAAESEPFKVKNILRKEINAMLQELYDAFAKIAEKRSS